MPPPHTSPLDVALYRLITPAYYPEIGAPDLQDLANLSQVLVELACGLDVRLLLIEDRSLVHGLLLRQMLIDVLKQREQLVCAVRGVALQKW